MSATIRNPGLVYKSTRPGEHLATVAANVAERERLTQAMEDFAKSLVPTGSAYGTRHDSTAASMWGIKVDSRDGVEVPVGLRWDTKAKRGQHFLVPAKKTDEGKAIAKKMASFTFNPQSLGAVSSVLVITDGTRSYFASAVIETITTAEGTDVYATYHLPLETTRHGSRPSDKDRVDADPGWAEIPLSEFYAARESASSRATTEPVEVTA